MVVIVRRAYEIVTEESARQGDTAENGWLTADDQQWQGAWKEGRKLAEIRFKTAKEAAKFIAEQGAIVGDDGYNSFYFEARQNMRTGDYISESAHVEASRPSMERIWSELAMLGAAKMRLGHPNLPFPKAGPRRRQVRVGPYRRKR